MKKKNECYTLLHMISANAQVNFYSKT